MNHSWFLIRLGWYLPKVGGWAYLILYCLFQIYNRCWGQTILVWVSTSWISEMRQLFPHRPGFYGQRLRIFFYLNRIPRKCLLHLTTNKSPFSVIVWFNCSFESLQLKMQLVYCFDWWHRPAVYQRHLCGSWKRLHNIDNSTVSLLRQPL